MDLKKLRQKLEENNIKILKEEEDLIPILIVDKIPESTKRYDKKRAWQRSHFSPIPPFMIKDADKGKTKEGYNLTQIEELRNEVKVWKENPDIPIVPKVAILKLKDSEKYFLVEELHEEFVDKWDGELLKRMQDIQEELNKNFEIDCKKENFIYDEVEDKLLLIDICIITKRKNEDARN